MKPLLVFTIALKQELPDCFKSLNFSIISLKAALAGDLRTVNSSAPFLCLITGVGMENSILASKWISEILCTHYNVQCVINLGSAGSLLGDLKIGSLVIPQQFSHKPHSIKNGLGCLPFNHQDSNLSSTPTCHSVTIQTDFEGTGIVDMEAYWQADIFEKMDIPFTAIKFITDHNNISISDDFTSSLPLLKTAFDSLFSCFTPEPINGISVVIPTFNRDYCLDRAIKSVLNQTFSSIECIVVDDGSTDETSSLLVSYQDQISVITHSQNKGVSASRNSGINNAKYPWISFLDSDDEWVAEKLQNQISFLERYPFYSVLQSNEKWIRNGKPFNQKKHHQKQSGFIFQPCLERCMIGPSSVMIHRSVFDRFGVFDESLPACEDYDLWLRLSRSLLIGLEPSISLIKHGGHPDQLSTSIEALDKYRIIALEKALSKETHPVFREHMASVLEKKKSIFLTGLAKRS